MNNLSKDFSNKSTPQTQPIPNKKMVANHGGGYCFELDKWKTFDRFLILGSEGGSFYQKEKELTLDNAKNSVECLKEDGAKFVNRIVEISTERRAIKENSNIFCLALACSLGNPETKKLAYSVITKICRTGTQIFQFCQDIQNLRGWSRGLRNGVAKYYTNRDVDNLVFQILKYRQRNGWTHKDVLRLCHAKPINNEMEDVFRYIVQNKKKPVEKLHPMIKGFEKIQASEEEAKVIKLIEKYEFVWEMIPTNYLKSCAIWKALLPNLKLEALVRNLGRMTANGFLDSNLSQEVKYIAESLDDEKLIKKSGLHPIKILNALNVYSKGEGDKGSLTWKPVRKIVDGLDGAFYKAFKTVEPTNKNIMLAIDVSGSMTWPENKIANMSMFPREAAGALALVTANVEPNYEIVVFSNGITKVDISPSQRLDDVINKINGYPASSTDCALPMLYATKHNMDVDCFIIYTDNETNSGSTHPKLALDAYRKAMKKKNAKCIVVAMTSTGFSIADPSDKGMLDLVGFDTNTPAIISEFIKL